MPCKQSYLRPGESFDTFCLRAAKARCLRVIQVGAARYGNSRSVFSIDGLHVHLESHGYRTVPDLATRRTSVPPIMLLWVIAVEPRDWWVLGEWVRGEKAARALANRYGGTANPDEYHADDEDAWYLSFPGLPEGESFRRMLQVIYDFRHGVLPPDTFPWLTAYEGSGARDADRELRRQRARERKRTAVAA